MASTDYEKMMAEGEVYLLPDVFPWSGVHIIDYSICTGIVKSCTVNTGSNIGTADIQFPKLIFGNHIKGLTPIKIAINDVNNVVFRGFIIEENGILSESEDSVTVRALSYKWYFSKCTKIRGRWFTSDDAVPSPYGSPNTIGTGKLKYEMYRGPLVRDDGRSGYIQNEPCIFNENSLPTCMVRVNTKGEKAIFKYRRMQKKNDLQYVRKYNYGAFYWTYSTILSHIVYWWLDPYSGTSTKIRISNSSFAKLSRLSEEDEIPMDLSIEGMNPLEAINTVVNSIPGKWVWYLRYSGIYVFVELLNLTETVFETKTFTVGDGSKQAEEPANVANMNVTRNWEESSSFIVCKGGKLRFTTTVELQPVWESNTVDGVSGLPFSSVEQFRKWKSYLSNKDNNTYTKEEVDLFERAFRYYCIPKEGEFLSDALENVDFKKSTDIMFSGRLEQNYAVIERELKKMFAHQVYLERSLDAPEHPEFENPIFFAYDDYRDKNPSGNVNEVNKVILLEENVNFDSDTGLVMFDTPQICQFSSMKVKDTETVKTEEGGEIEVDTTADESTIKINSIANIDASVATEGYPLVSRRIFCTLTIVLDMPYVIGDDIFGLHYEEGGNFSRYVDFDGNDLRIHANAFYPVLPNKNVTVTPQAYTLATKGSKQFAVDITSDMCQNALYPAEYMEDYEMYPDENDKLLFQKLDNLKASINKHTENINVDLGVLDLTYNLGDIIVAVENSAVEGDYGSGYYGLKDYISQITWSMEGGNQSYTTRVVATNDVGFTPKDFDKVIGDTIRRPSVLRGNYKSNSYLKVDTDG